MPACVRPFHAFDKDIALDFVGLLCGRERVGDVNLHIARCAAPLAPRRILALFTTALSTHAGAKACGVPCVSMRSQQPSARIKVHKHAAFRVFRCARAQHISVGCTGVAESSRDTDAPRSEAAGRWSGRRQPSPEPAEGRRRAACAYSSRDACTQRVQSVPGTADGASKLRAPAARNLMCMPQSHTSLRSGHIERTCAETSL